MIPSPTRPPSPPNMYPPAVEQETTPATKKVAMTPSRRRLGETPAARAIKAILRPIFKALYYAIAWIRTHKLVMLIAIVLLAASIVLTTYFTTGALPFSSSNSASGNSAQQNIQGNPQISPYIQQWLVALQNGDFNSMLTIEKMLPTTNVPPDNGAYLTQYSQKYAGVTWTKVAVTNSTAPDGTIDTYVTIDMTLPATTTTAAGKMIVVWHFTTVPQVAGRLLQIDFVSARQSLA